MVVQETSDEKRSSVVQEEGEQGTIGAWMRIYVSDSKTLKLKAMYAQSEHVCQPVINIPQVGFVMNTKEHTKILEACHKDPTSGHMGTKKTLAHVTSCGLGAANNATHLVSNWTTLSLPFSRIKKTKWGGAWVRG